MLEKFKAQITFNAYSILGGANNAYEDIIIVDDINALHTDSDNEFIGIEEIDTA